MHPVKPRGSAAPGQALQLAQGFLLVRDHNRLPEQQESAPAAPTDKECPFCRFTIPIDATCCAHCTSELSAVGPA